MSLPDQVSFLIFVLKNFKGEVNVDYSVWRLFVTDTRSKTNQMDQLSSEEEEVFSVEDELYILVWSWIFLRK